MISKVFSTLLSCDSVCIPMEQTPCCLEMYRGKFLVLYIYLGESLGSLRAIDTSLTQELA